MRECSQCGAEKYIGQLQATLDRSELLDPVEENVVKAIESFRVC